MAMNKFKKLPTWMQLLSCSLIAFLTLSVLPLAVLPCKGGMDFVTFERTSQLCRGWMIESYSQWGSIGLSVDSDALRLKTVVASVLIGIVLLKIIHRFSNSES